MPDEINKAQERLARNPETMEKLRAAEAALDQAVEMEVDDA